MNSLIFDLDGTLVDTVHAHVSAWQKAMLEFDISVDAARIHRRIGMSGQLLMQQCAGETSRSPSSDEMAAMDALHSSIFAEICPEPRPLNGAKELIRHLKSSGIQFGIATSGKRPDINSSLSAIGLGGDTVIVDGSATEAAKPEPDLFNECLRKLGVTATQCYVVGDSIWDVLAARRAGILALGLLCGGSSEDDLYRACAYRVYDGPIHLRCALGELGFC